MSSLLFRLNQVDAEEAEAVRQLLHEHDIEFYETSSGLLGISVAAIWLHDSDDLPRARALLDEYQHERGERLRARWQADSERGEQETFAKKLQREPLKVIAGLAAIGVVLYFSLMPFFDLWP